jgi:hypothetical protein
MEGQPSKVSRASNDWRARINALPAEQRARATAVLVRLMKARSAKQAPAA